jgi:hypothetical protein
MSYNWLEASMQPWDILGYEEDDHPVSVFIFSIFKKFGFTTMANGPLCPQAGIWIIDTSLDQANKVRIMDASLKFFSTKLSNIASFINLKLHPRCDFPFEYKSSGFNIHRRKTYQIYTHPREEQLFQNIDGKQRNNIKSALSHLEVLKHDDIVLHNNLVSNSFNRVNMPNLVSQRQTERIFSKYGGEVVKLYKAGDAQKVHSSLLAVEDKETVYILSQGMADQCHRGANAVLIWHTILHAKSQNKVLDFEGSEIPRIEKFYKSFGGQIQYYTEVSKYNSSLFYLLKSIQKRL